VRHEGKGGREPLLEELDKYRVLVCDQILAAHVRACVCLRARSCHGGSNILLH
jgi:hypothetical protein